MEVLLLVLEEREEKDEVDKERGPEQTMGQQDEAEEGISRGKTLRTPRAPTRRNTPRHTGFPVVR